MYSSKTPKIKHKFTIVLNRKKNDNKARISARQWNCDVDHVPARLPPSADHGRMLTNAPTNEQMNQQTWRIAIPPAEKINIFRNNHTLVVNIAETFSLSEYTEIDVGSVELCPGPH